MKIVIMHDYFGGIGGGEKLVLSMARALKADVITTDVDMDAWEKMDPGDIAPISLGETIKIPPLKQVSASYKFATCDFTGKYDFFIFSGNWAHYASKKHHPNMWYCHTPVRAFYHEYEKMIRGLRFPNKQVAQIWAGIHRKFDRYYAGHVDKIATNSQHTARRIKRCYGREAVVVYPPIDTSRYAFKEYGDFWLSVNRLYPEKRVELQVEAFRRMPEEKLVIVGGYQRGDQAQKYVGKITKDLPGNVELRGSVSEIELIHLYATCKGLVCTAMNEDFGMTTVEALASGKPVVATKEGGYLEVLIEGATGEFVGADVSEIVAAVRRVSRNPEKFRTACQDRAREFDVSMFIKKIKKEIGFNG